MAAVSSMRLLVVAASNPDTSLRSLPDNQQRRPAAGTRIAAAGAVGEDLDLGQGRTLLVGSAAPTNTRWRTRRRGLHQGQRRDALARLEQVGTRRERPPAMHFRGPAFQRQEPEIPMDAVDIEPEQRHPVAQVDVRRACAACRAEMPGRPK